MPEQMRDLINHLDRIATALERIAAGSYPKTPTGEPICPRHGVVLRKREKQGDTWYSHRVTDARTGEMKYCRGHNDAKNGPGWHIPLEHALLDAPDDDPPQQPARNGDGEELFSYRYRDGAEATKPVEKAAFDAYRRDNDERPPSSREELRSWYRRNGDGRTFEDIDDVNADIFGN